MFQQQPFGHNLSPASNETWALHAANEAVSEFVRFVRDTNVGNDLVDEIELPLPKPVLIEAFKRVIVAEERPEMRALLLKAGLMLSHYHVGLGERIRVTPIASHRREKSGDPRLEVKFKRTLLFTAAERTRLTKVYEEALKRALH
ncbi:hypothetical protein QTL95_21850 [Rhizobium sp. S152]|uniref:hypothetical protein n=1 Tax=Rhizobium sp. S152 TaxID=3055038 RepID=UPI0025A9F46C|nr:hypothetical protein [Rhizobium sp. S152]MDM9628546.1 hypothetical protein [Rhizobium sp. S152]